MNSEENNSDAIQAQQNEVADKSLANSHNSSGKSVNKRTMKRLNSKQTKYVRRFLNPD